jgi:diguanylate cyclase (GGDEF)-like protein/PAS domain S-box-containing protein
MPLKLPHLPTRNALAGWWQDSFQPLIAVTTILAAVMFVALGTYAALSSRQHYDERAELLTQSLAEATERNVSANVDKIDFALTAVVRHLEDQLRRGPIDPSLADDFVRLETAQRPELKAIRATDVGGLVVVGPDRDAMQPGPFLGDRQWFKIQRAKPDAGLVMSAPLQGRFNEGWIISFSRRYVGPDGEFAGAVTAAVPVSYFARMLNGINVGPHGIVVLRDANLALIARVPNGSVAPVRDAGDKHVSAELTRLVNQGVERATYRALNTADGVERIDTLHKMGGTPLYVIVGVAPQDYLAQWHTEVRTLATLCGAAVVVQLTGAFLLLRLVRQNRQARSRIELMAKVFEHSGEAIVITDRNNRIVEVNPAFTAQSGYPAHEVLGRDPKLLESGPTGAASRRAMRDAIADSGFWRGEVWNRAKDGREYAKWLSLAVVRDARGSVEYHIGSSIDMTELKQAEAKIRELAHHDTLTRLPNRAHLQARLEQAMASARRDRNELAMLFIDLDRFKNINDTLGHDAGDALLIEVARRLQGTARESDIVARLGGDEFIVVLTGISDGVRGGATMAGKILAELGRPYAINGQALHSTPSIGVSVYPEDGATSEALMKAADIAMYHAKAAGRNNYQFFTRAMTEAAAERVALEAALRVAVERGEFLLYYQPQVDLRSDRIVGMEALLRWCHPERGMVSPLTFISIAEECGLIESIGKWVLDHALAQLARWRTAGFGGLRVAVNLSMHQLRNERFPELVARSLAVHGLDGDALELEITESTAMHDPARTARLMSELRALGVALAIDDFGTGHSSLAYLKQLPLSCLKLDRSFVADLEHDTNDAAICTATIQLAHSLGLAVVAEGIESRAQLEFLRGLKCDMGQGFYIGKPMAGQDCDGFLRAWPEEMSQRRGLAIAG